MADIRFSQAASAYQDAFRAAQNIIEKTSSGSAGETQEAPGTSFSDMVSGALKSAVATGYKSEHISTQSLLGKASMTDVVTAVADAETTLNTVVAIRDRVINAYQDIIKMPM
jgi:flagellar hook-basal body complex protein FliE